MALSIALIGCNTDKVDMTTIKSPDAGPKIVNNHVSEKPRVSPYKVQKISDGQVDQTKG